jgi:hypothetical protein
MSTILRVLPALGAGFAFTLGGAGEEIAFRPESGARVTKTFTLTGEFELDDLSLMVNGQDVSGMMPPVELSMKQRTTVEVTDVYRSFANGRLLELVRTYDVLAGSMDMLVSPAPDEEMPEMDSVSALEGRTVVFRWNADKDEYERSFEGEEGDAELLEDLDEDMDLRTFLPEGEIEVGDSWTVPLAALATIVMPGGNLGFRPEDMTIDDGAHEKFEELFGGFGERFADLLEGDCTCTYKGTREEDGTRVAEIEIDLAIGTTIDLSEMLDELIRTALEDGGMGEMIQFSIDGADLNLDFDGEGTLLWSLAAGRARAFHLSGDAIVGMDMVVGVEVEGESQDVDASVEFSGSVLHELVTSE